jgi:signal transduction histidine kinase
VSLSEVIESVLSLFAKRIAEKKIYVVSADEPCTIQAFKGDLHQLFANLIANAIEAVSISGRIELSVHPNGRNVMVAVQDDGTDIQQEHLPKLFEPFFSTKHRHMGTGLGLWISKEIAQEHGARIAVESGTDASRHGTTFRVTIPAACTETPIAAD